MRINGIQLIKLRFLKVVFFLFIVVVFNFVSFGWLTLMNLIEGKSSQ